MQTAKGSAPFSNLLQKLQKHRQLGLQRHLCRTAASSENQLITQSPLKQVSRRLQCQELTDASLRFEDRLQEPQSSPTPSPTAKASGQNKALQEDLASLKRVLQEDHSSFQAHASPLAPRLQAWSLEESETRPSSQNSQRFFSHSVQPFCEDALAYGINGTDGLEEVDVWDDFSEQGDILLPGSVDWDDVDYEPDTFIWEESFGAGTRLKDACRQAGNKRMSKLFGRPVNLSRR
mmetsp:Transcript_4812/g.8565  ORF Transcript_4812/g.8565 Transcript_4812/m.8565 type:complete len:234 (+) Transcript_4812:82-783(+)